MTARSIVALVVAAGTATGCATMLVRDVQIDGHDLVIEKCPFYRHWWHVSSLRSCTTERQRLPVIRTIATITPVTPVTLTTPAATAVAPVAQVGDDEVPGSHAATPSAVRTGFAGVGHAVSRCGTQHGLDGVIRVTLVIEAGRLSRVDPDRGGEAFAACLRTALDGLSFEGRGGTMSVPFKIVSGVR